MKYFATLFCILIFLALSWSVFAQSSTGMPDPYRKVFVFPDCRIFVVLDDLKDRTKENGYINPTPTDLYKHRFYWNTIQRTFGQMPAELRNEFDSLEIHLSHTENDERYNWRRQEVLFLETRQIRPGLTEEGSLTTSLLAELGYIMAAKRQDITEMKIALRTLEKFRMKIPGYGVTFGMQNCYDQGYINDLVLSGNPQRYDPKEEFGEIFAHLICPETRDSANEYIENNTESVLAKKVAVVHHAVRVGYPVLADFPEGINLQLSEPADSEQSQLIAAHELRAFEVNMEPLTEDDTDFDNSSSNDYLEFASLKNEFTSSPAYQNGGITYLQGASTKENDDKVSNKEPGKKSPHKKKGRGGWVLLGLVLLSLALAGE